MLPGPFPLSPWAVAGLACRATECRERQTGPVFAFLTRRRSPGKLFAVMFLAWVVTIATLQASTSTESPWLDLAMAVVMLLGLALSAVTFLLFLLSLIRR